MFQINAPKEHELLIIILGLLKLAQKNLLCIASSRMKNY